MNDVNSALNHQKLKKNKSHAFTIVELLVVIVVIGILAAISIVSYTGITKKAGDASLQADLSNASKKIKLYYALYGSYPTSMPLDMPMGNYCPSGPTPDTNYCIKPSPGNSFEYSAPTPATDFELIATKESANTAYKITKDTGPLVENYAAASFAKTWGGVGNNYAYNLVQTSDNGFIVVGYTEGFGAGSADAFLAKFNVRGSLVWNKTWGGAGNDFGYDIVQTSDNGYAITGSTTSYGAGSADAFISKFDTNGNLAWSKTWGGAGSDYGRGLIQSIDGGYALVGSTDSYGAGVGDAILLKYDASGNLTWNRTWGGTGSDNSYSIVQATDGGYVLAGDTSSYGTGGGDVFLNKYDSSGTISWSRTWGGSSDDQFKGLIKTNDGGYMLSGITNSYGVANGDAFLAKFNSSAVLSWSRTWGGPLNDYGFSVAQSSDNGYVLVGYTNGGAGGWDLFMAKYDTNGTFSWVKTYGDNWTDALQGSKSVIQAADGNYLVTGYTNSYGAHNINAFLLKIKSDGIINNCPVSLCHDLALTAMSPTASVTTPSASVSSPTATVASPTATVTTPSATVTTIVAP